MEHFQRLGVMGEWDDPYLTMKYESEAAIVAELMKFAMSGQLYRGAKPVMWSPVEKTALAEAEVEYEDIVSTQIDVAFEIVEAPNAPELVGAHAAIWTTTPWTIPVNQALAYSEEVEYLHFLDPFGDYSYLVANDRELLAKFIGRLRNNQLDSPINSWSDLERACAAKPADVSTWLSEINDGKVVKSEHLAGTVARHPMHHLGGFFAKPRPFLPGDFVTTEAGTGLVHMAPDHGEDDFLLCKAHGIDTVFAVEDDGRYRQDWLWLGGQGSVINKKFNAPDGPICADLRDAGALLSASEDFQHSYPHSWRSKAKVIFRATPQWFIPMDKSISSPLVGEDQGGGPAASEADKSLSAADAAGPHPSSSPRGGGETLRQTALAAIEETRWVPARSKNRIRSMVEGRPDWVISRQRAWGVPIALYVHRKTGDYLRDKAVNARIVEAFRQGGAHAWFTAHTTALLGTDSQPTR